MRQPSAGDWRAHSRISCVITNYQQPSWTQSPSAGRRRNPAGWSLCRSQGGLGLLSALSTHHCSSYSVQQKPFGHCLERRQDMGARVEAKAKATCRCISKVPCRSDVKAACWLSMQPYGEPLACLVWSRLCVSRTSSV